MENNVILAGAVSTWSLGGAAREYLVVTLPFAQARLAFKVDRFNHSNGPGEQRELDFPHVARLKRAMLAGEYTPTPVSAGVRADHAADVDRDGPVARVRVYPDRPLPQTDGQQRFQALADIRDQAQADGDEALAAAVDAAPITAVVMLDGDTKRDFLNLQEGRSVDPAHVLSLRVTAKMLAAKDQKAVKAGYDAARALAGDREGPFHKLVRFQSKGASGLGRLPVTTLLARGASDLATSLVGLAKAGGDLPARRLAGLVTAAYQALAARGKSLLEEGKVLTPLAETGSRGAATMMVGVGVCLAYRLKALGREEPTKDDLAKLVAAAKATLDKPVAGQFSGPTKRALMKAFAAEYLQDLPEDKHDGLPAGLLRDLSCSSFGVPPLPKAPKKRAGAVRPAKASEKKAVAEVRPNPLPKAPVDPVAEARLEPAPEAVPTSPEAAF